MDIVDYLKVVPYSPWAIFMPILPIVIGCFFYDLSEGKRKRLLYWGVGALIIVFGPFLILGPLDFLAFETQPDGSGIKAVRTFLWARFSGLFLWETPFWLFTSGWAYATGKNYKLGKFALIVFVWCLIIILILCYLCLIFAYELHHFWEELSGLTFCD
jgi:hypothetical protein